VRSSVGVYFLIVNPAKRQYLDPARFGEAVTAFRCEEAHPSLTDEWRFKHTRRERMSESPIHGGCLCGAVTFEVSPPFLRMVH
jgi:hypothetical protein